LTANRRRIFPRSKSPPVGRAASQVRTELDTAEVTSQYKCLWMVEQWFRSGKTLLQTRLIYHRCDATIRGHVFCSFLALVLRQDLQSRLEEWGHKFEWADVIADLDRLQTVEVEQDGKRFQLRSDVRARIPAMLTLREAPS
jgi:transposase